MSDLIVVTPDTKAVDIFQPQMVDKVLEKIKKEVSAFKPDISSKKGRDEVASMAYKISRSKTLMDKLGKELGEDARKKIESINAERRKITTELDALRDEVRKPLTDWENKEKERVENHQREIFTIEETGKSIEAGYLSIALEEMESNLKILSEANRDFEEFQEKSEDAISVAKLRIALAIEKRKKHDHELAETARLKAEAEEKARKEREDAIAREAAEKAKREAELKAAREKAEAQARAEAEKKRIEDEKKSAELEKIRAEERARAAEQARIDAEKRAAEAAKRAEEEKKAAILAEKARLEKAEADRKAREQADIEKREANKRHVAKINNSAVKAFLSILNIEESLAKEIVISVAKRRIPNMEIKY